MTLQIYEDFESAAEFAGRWSIIESGTGSVSLTSESGWPTRGKTGVSLSVGTSSTAHIQTTLAEASECYMGYWLRITKETMTTAYQWLGTFRSAAAYPVMGIRYYPNDNVQLYVYEGASSNWSAATPSGLADGEWHYLKWGYKVGEFGRLWVDDQLVIDLQSNPTGNVGLLRFGPWTPIAMGGEFVIDCDEIKIGSTLADVEPYTPTATSDYVEPQRTVILYRDGNADSRAFAQYAANTLGVPSLNLCPLPCSGNETLADYATFQTEIETPLNQWLIDHPTQAAQTSAFLVGYGVPGYFTHSGKTIATESRLANLGNVFNGPTANPFAGRKARITAAELKAAGMYLATRIDGATLANAQAILNAGDSPITLSEADQLHTDETDYAASLACQATRLITTASGALGGDGFVFTANTFLGFGPTGSRCGFVHKATASADSLRTGSWTQSAMDFGYASAMGFAAEAYDLDPEAYFAVLLAGGTIAEAMLCASSVVDAGIVMAGCGLLQCDFPAGGYNVYRGETAEEITEPVAYLRPGENLKTFPQPLDSVRYYRITAVSSAGRESLPSVALRVERTATGQIIAGRPNRPIEATAHQVGSNVELRIVYSPAGCPVTATTLQIARDGDWTNSIATADLQAANTTTATLTLGPFGHGETLRLAARAVTAAGVAGSHRRLPAVTIDTAAPSPVTNIIARSASV